MSTNPRLLRGCLDSFDTYTLLAMVNLHGKLPVLQVPALLHHWNDTLGPKFPSTSPAIHTQDSRSFHLSAEERGELTSNSFVSNEVIEEIDRLRFERTVRLPRFGTIRYITREKDRDTSLIERTLAWCRDIMPLEDDTMTHGKPLHAPRLHLTIFFTPLTKTAGQVLSPNEINSGCTIFRGEQRKIYIWREEDLLRTILHEMVHALDYDFRIQMNLRTTNIFNEIAATNELNINETYTEVVAVILHCIAIVHILRIPTAFSTLLTYEYAHSLAICNKILDHYELPGLSCINETTCRIDEKTNVIEYTLFKTLCLRDLNTMVREQFLRKQLSFDVDEIYDFNEFLLNGLNDDLYKTIRSHRNDFSESLRFVMFALHHA